MKVGWGRKGLRYGFAAFAAYLLVQAAAAMIIVEPYPAFIYPPFARVKGERGTIDLLEPQLTVRFEDGTSATATLAQAFDGVPLNLASAVAKGALFKRQEREAVILGQLEPGYKQSLVRWRSELRRHRPYVDIERADPGLRAWLRENLQRHFQRSPVELTLRWWNVILRPERESTDVRRELLGKASCKL